MLWYVNICLAGCLTDAWIVFPQTLRTKMSQPFGDYIRSSPSGIIYGVPLLEMGLNSQEILLRSGRVWILREFLANPLVVTCNNWMNLAITLRDKLTYSWRENPTILMVFTWKWLGFSMANCLGLPEGSWIQIREIFGVSGLSPRGPWSV